MKGLIYRELYLCRKSIILMIIAYVLFVLMMCLIVISTYAGNLENDPDADKIADNFYSIMYFYGGLIAIIGLAYGHNDIIEKDYKSRWQLYSYTIPINDKKIAASKLGIRLGLLFCGFLLAFLADVIFSVAARKELSLEHFKNICLMMFIYGTISISDIPTMLRLKTQGKAAAVGFAVFVPVLTAIVFGGIKINRFFIREAARLYPDMDRDAAYNKLSGYYMTKGRDIALYIAPVIFVGAIVLSYFMTVKQLKRRRY